ncbi:BA75_00908T0 [Komagataella pastoris]|uniref:BA75_00908T0 n=1 Tax=Komagataella pastoris TaxID=4922 RepID=A0A1B2J580_PICPA|nr:BA75_00908T0 [Komagataella pastoris]
MRLLHISLLSIISVLAKANAECCYTNTHTTTEVWYTTVYARDVSEESTSTLADGSATATSDLSSTTDSSVATSATTGSTSATSESTAANESSTSDSSVATSSSTTSSSTTSSLTSSSLTSSSESSTITQTTPDEESTSPTSSSSQTSSSTTTTSDINPTASSDFEAFRYQILDEHNVKRALHGVDGLEWDDEVYAAAQAYADAYTCDGTLVHSGNSLYGENLAYGYSTRGTVDAWYSEIDLYDFNNPGYTPGVGHFTQVVWKSTTKLGCAFKYCNDYYGTYVVCNYSPPGNYVNEGYFEANVLPLVD